MRHSSRSAMLFGALVADAASLGVHWIYDPARIQKIAGALGSASFVPVDPANYDGGVGYFAHATRTGGMLSQYGEVLRLAIQSINAQGGFDPAAYAQDFAAHFGPGGAYQGYIDRPTRGTLGRIAAEQTPTGIDDDQLPATARLPAIVAGYGNNPDMLKAAMEVTNVNNVAAAYSAVFADLLLRLLDSEGLQAAMAAAVAAADPSIRADVADALSTTQTSSTDYAEKTGRACHLPMAGPLAFHILRHSASFADAVERNNLAGGDSAGRAILIGAVMGCVHGVAGETGIPLAWALNLTNGAAIWAECQALGG